MKTLIIDGSRPFGAPKNWDPSLDGECGTLHVLEAKDVLSGYPVLYSFYQPSAEDLEALKSGGAIRLGVMGGGHPVIQLGVVGPKAMSGVNPRDGFEMGPVLEDD